MERLLEAVTAVVCLVSPEKVRAVASRIRQTESSQATTALSGVVGTPTASALLDRLIAAWRTTTISADELALMLLSASHVFTETASQQSSELVWTGPTTPFVSARRTEQALLQVLNAAERSLFITSFVAYDVAAVVKALNAAIDRGVDISMLLELSQNQGGSISFDAVSKMQVLVPRAKLYVWQSKVGVHVKGRVHAKLAVADGRICFITSANLTGHAMEKNMEAGVLIAGGQVPALLNDHLHSLVVTKIIEQV